MSVVHPLLLPVVSIIAGIVILVFPKVLNFIVALYLILLGILGLLAFYSS